MRYTHKQNWDGLFQYPYGNNILFTSSQLSKDALLSKTSTDELGQKGRSMSHRQVPSLKIILTKISGEKLLH